MAQVSVQPFYSGRAYYDVTSADGQKYVFVPKEFVEKGFVQNGQQFYSPGFLTPEALTTASAFTLPDDSSLTGAAKSIYQEPTKGFLWKADDFNKINYDDFSFRTYQPTSTYGVIKGYTLKDGVPYYIQEPAPGANYTLLDKDGTSTNTTVTVTRTGGGGGLFGGLFGDLVSGLSNELAKLDPSTAISRELTNLYQPVEKAISTGLADVDKNLSLSKNAPVIAAVAIAVVVPVVGAEIGASLMEAGVVTSAAEASAAVMAAGGTAAQAAAAAASATATATAVGTAIASATAQVAQGVPVEEAIRNATVAATVQLNAPGAAKAVNDIVGNPVVSNLVSSTAASVVQTAATGGSEADIIRNARGALIGSGVSSGTDSNVLGRAAAGGVTGGVAGALVGAAGAVGATANLRDEAAQVEQEQDAPSILPTAKPAVVSTAEQDIRNLMANISPGVQTADMSGAMIAMPKGVRDETAEKLGINLPRIGSDMTVVDPETKGTLPTVSVVAPRDEPITFQEGQPDLPELNKAGEGLVVLGDKAATGGGSSVSPADQKVLDLIKPTPTTVTPTTVTPSTFTPAIAPRLVPQTPTRPANQPVVDTFNFPKVTPADQAIIDLTSIGGGNVGGNVVVGPGADAGAGNATGNVVISDAGGGNATSNVVIDTGPGGGNTAGNVIVSDGGLGGGNAAGNVVISDGGLGGGGGNAAGNVIVGPGDGDGGGLGGNVTIDVGGGGGGNATSNVSGNVVVDEPPKDDDKKVVDEDKKDDTVDDTYTPDVFIYGGVSPKTKTRTRTDLSTTLQAPFYPSSTLGQALTGYRGAGEIEGKKSGKPRKNVWNEESLRLKDALGL